MQKISVMYEDDTCKQVIVSETETPNQILVHFNMNPDTKIVYINGAILSREKMGMPVGGYSRPTFMVVKNKAVIR